MRPVAGAWRREPWSTSRRRHECGEAGRESTRSDRDDEIAAPSVPGAVTADVTADVTAGVTRVDKPG
jgi:hypothetical protein